MSDGCCVSLELVSAVKESSISTVPIIGVLGKDYLTYACILYEYKHRCTLLIYLPIQRKQSDTTEYSCS